MTFRLIGMYSFKEWEAIGDYVTLSRGSTILTVGLNTKDYFTNCMNADRPYKLQLVMICESIWIGANAMVMSGVTIAASPVVTHNLDREVWLYGGVPAKR